MVLSKAESLNAVYALGKKLNKKTKVESHVVGKWINQDLWEVEGKEERICSFKEMSKWRYFRESQEYVSSLQLKPGDRVLAENNDGVEVWFYVIYEVGQGSGEEYKYVIGI